MVSLSEKKTLTVFENKVQGKYTDWAGNGGDRRNRKLSLCTRFF